MSQIVINSSAVARFRTRQNSSRVVVGCRNTVPRCKRANLIVKAQEQKNEEEEFEARLAALKTAKNQTPSGQGKKAQLRKQKKQQNADEQDQVAYKSTEEQKTYDFSDEVVYFESGPHVGDLVTNLVMGATLVWLPLTIASVTRAAFVKYRFTDKRFTVTTDAPWQKEESDIAYQQVKEVVSVNRGLGFWGDMVVTLADNSKVEMRSIPKHEELRQYILDRRDALLGTAEDLGERKSMAGKGFQ